MAFTTIWSIDLGKSALKAVKIRRDRGNVEILAIDKVDYTPTAAGPATGAEATAQVREALSVFRARNDVRDPLIVMHPGQGTFSRFIKVPAFDAKKLKEMVRYEASQQIPFPLDEVIWDAHVVDREYASGEERDVGLFAVRKETIDDFLVDFTNEQLRVEMLTIGYLATLNFVQFDLHPDEPSIVLDIGASSTDLILIDGRRFWIRALPHSGNDVTRSIMSRFKLDFATAEKVKIEAVKVQKQATKIFEAVIRPKLQDLVQEVHRSIGYYRSQNGEVKFAGLYLLGNGSKLIGIKKYMEDHLQIPTQRLESISRLRVNRDVNVKLLQSDLPSFACAMGGACQAVGLGVANIDLIPKEEKIKKEIGRKKKHAFFAAGIVLVAILIAHLMLQQKVDRAEGVLKRTENIPKLYKKQVADLQKETQEGIGATMKVLEGVAEHRQASLDALRSVERVFAEIPTGPPEPITVQEKDAEPVQAALAKYKEDLQEKVWIPYFQIVRSDYPEEQQKRTGPAAKEKKPTAPAYKVTALVAVPARAKAGDANASIIRKFQQPLEKDLKLGQRTLLTDVNLVPVQGASSLNALYWEAGRGGAGDNLVQEGGPFYAEEAQWTMLKRFPEEPKAAPEKTEGPKK